LQRITLFHYIQYMKLFIPTNWDDRLIDALAKAPVAGVYGSFGDSPLINSEPQIPSVCGRTAAKRHIELIRSQGWRFTYELNTGCTGNRENSPAFRKTLYDFFLSLCDMGVTDVSISNPYLLELISTHVPALRVTVSAVARINTIARAMLYLRLGADTLAVDPAINRDFSLLAALNASFPGKVALVANSLCLYQCPFIFYHANCNSHLSLKNSFARTSPLDYCAMHCAMETIADPAAILRSRWIRPQDCAIYEQAGFDGFILLASGTETSKITALVNAYADRRFDGNLLDILARPYLAFSGELRTRRYFRTLSLRELFHVDTSRLDGFIDHFLSGLCRADCSICSYCTKLAQSVIIVKDDLAAAEAKSAMAKELAFCTGADA